MVGLFATYLLVLVTLALGDIVRSIGIESISRAFGWFLLVAVYGGGGAAAGGLALVFLARHLPSERKRTLTRVGISAIWIMLCGALPSVVMSVMWWQERDWTLYVRNSIGFFVYGAIMALCLVFYARSRSTVGRPNAIYVCLAGAVVLALLPPLFGLFGNGLGRIVLCASVASALWAASVTYFILSSRAIEQGSIG